MDTANPANVQATALLNSSGVYVDPVTQSPLGPGSYIASDGSTVNITGSSITGGVPVAAAGSMPLEYKDATGEHTGKLVAGVLLGPDGQPVKAASFSDGEHKVAIAEIPAASTSSVSYTVTSADIQNAFSADASLQPIKYTVSGTQHDGFLLNTPNGTALLDGGKEPVTAHATYFDAQGRTVETYSVTPTAEKKVEAPAPAPVRSAHHVSATDAPVFATPEGGVDTRTSTLPTSNAPRPPADVGTPPAQRSVEFSAPVASMPGVQVNYQQAEADPMQKTAGEKKAEASQALGPFTYALNLEAAAPPSVNAAVKLR